MRSAPGVRLLAASAGLITILSGTFAGAPAQAASPIGLSNDGVHWSSSLGGSLFAPGVRWVPGDTRSASFYVRNQASDPADLTIAVNATDPDGVLTHDDLSLRVQFGDGPPELLAVGGAGRVNADVLPEGHVRRATVIASLAAGSGNRSQSAGVSFELQVTLVQASAVALGDSGLLARTGADPRWPLAVGCVLLGLGVALLRLRRERTGGPNRG